jgi:hypothetical protein
MTPAATSSSSSLQDIPPSSAKPSPSVGGDFTYCISDALSPDSLAPTTMQAVPSFAATPFIETVSFLALLPVLCYMKNRYYTTLGLAAICANGSFDLALFITNDHFIYTLGELTFHGPN